MSRNKLDWFTSPDSLLILPCRVRLTRPLEAIASAAAIAPDDPGIAIAHARVRHETWRPSVVEATRAIVLAPKDPGATAMLASALAAAGDVATADQILSRSLAALPAWQAGHRQLMQLRLTAGLRDGFDRTIADACASLPADVSLRLAWFQALVSIKDWTLARSVVWSVPCADEPPLGLRLARLFLASETDEASSDPALFDEVADVCDVGLHVARTRLHLRIGQPERAAAIAQGWIGSPAERIMWPYMSLAWRVLGDGRADWLDRHETAISTIGLDLTERQLRDLATLLRSLLRMNAPFPEQSVRGGVQTDRHLFFHPDETIARVRAKALDAVRDYAERLPPLDDSHPLKVAADTPCVFDGSWSVLLRAGGHHAPHTHSRGWLSSALHVELADDSSGTEQRAGWTAFGEPPEELRLALPPTRVVKPLHGQLILFPSTTWHRTIPFASGDRLSIAFDVSHGLGATR